MLKYIVCFTLAVLVQARSPPRDICKLPSETGPCRAAFQRYFYNSITGACEIFTYGGCRGNENNFKSVGECEKTCGNKEIKPTKHVCPEVKCSGDCKYGYEIDIHGCNTCKCKSNPKLIIDPCGPVCAIYCPNGNILDRRGCPTCTCKPDFPRRPLVAQCPKNSKSNIQCPAVLQEECSSDADCAGRKKCCVFGCSKKCVNPRYTPSIFPARSDS